MSGQLSLAEAKFHTAPEMPAGRPPTRAEVWDYVCHYYPDKPEQERTLFARDRWAGNYVYYVNFLGWRKQPDWTEGETVIHAAVPSKPFEAGHGRSYYKDVLALLERARERSGK